MTEEAPIEPTPPENEAPKALSRFERRERAAADALRTLLRDVYLYTGGNTPAEQLKPFDLELRLRAEPGNAWALAFDPSLAEQMRDRLADAQALCDVAREGHVFCFRCERADCEHAAPPSTVSVFRGYEANGLPMWSDWPQALIDFRDERVDALYAPRPAVLARMLYGRDIRDRQLPSFGRSSKTYAVLGQVMAGYFAAGDEHVAVTLQAVETRNARGRPQLMLNTIARLPNGLTIEEWLADEQQGALARARAVANRALSQLSGDLAEAAAQRRLADRPRLFRRVPGILHVLAESLERGGRQGQRRTRHVEQRRREHRPVHKALDDASRAGDDAFFLDERRKTYAVCGPQGRAHVFNAEGRHVTSLTLPPDGIETRLRTGRWRRLADEELERVRRALDASARHHPDERSTDEAGRS